MPEMAAPTKKLPSTANKYKTLVLESIRLVPINVAVPDKCEMECWVRPTKPIALTYPATSASTNALYSIHRGKVESIESPIAVYDYMKMQTELK